MGIQILSTRLPTRNPEFWNTAMVAMRQCVVCQNQKPNCDTSAHIV